MTEEKQTLRSEITEKLSKLYLQDTASLSKICCQKAAESNILRPKQSVIAVFSAHRSELDLSSLHTLLPDKKLCYPRCLPGKQLAFHIVESPETMIPGVWGISEPDPDKHPEVDISKIDLFLCPGLAFGRDGSRLGHGGGYYDRALATKSPDAQAWGIGMDIQLLDSVPSETHDQLLDGVITESGIIPAIHG